MKPVPHRGRGAESNPTGRFDRLKYEPDADAELSPDEDNDPPRSPQTQFLTDSAQSVVTQNNSPDVGFDTSVNPYRGCEHGCIYCYARPTHEFLGFSAGLDFETKIMVKHQAPTLLRRELESPRWRPRVVAMSGVTDCYQPVERELRLTRGCLEVLAEFRNPAVIITKNQLVARDADVLGELARHEAAAVWISVTTLDAGLAREMEPRASSPNARLGAVAALAEAGVPVGVLVAPVVPGLTDHEMPDILRAAAKAGAKYAGYTTLRLPYGVKDLFAEWLAEHRPLRKEKVLERIRDLRGGKLNESDFKTRMTGEGIFAEQLRALFHLGCRRAGLGEDMPALSAAAFRRAAGEQMSLFE